jgi:type II secretion system protein I
LKKQASDKKTSLENRGFTLVEVIAAMAIMSTSLLAIFSTARSCLMAAERSGKLTRAVMIAETLLNEQMLDEQISYRSSQGQRDEFSWQIRIMQTNIENLAKIEITVLWGRQSPQQEYQLISFLYIEPTVLVE